MATLFSLLTRMASGSGIEPVIGKRYRYSYIGGRVYDPDRMDGEGIFVHKFTTAPNNKGNTRDLYIFAERLPAFAASGAFPARPEMYYLRYISKDDIKAARGDMNAGFPIDDLVTMMNSPDYAHPRLDGFMTPWKLMDVNEIGTIVKREKARGNIGSFMTHVIYHPPIRKTNATGRESTVFTGGPMYKRGMVAFEENKKRKSRKQRGGLGQPLSYTDPSHQEPSANAGFNRQGIEPPYLIRPALAAIPMRGGAEQILSPMSFRDAYHSDPMAPTGQPLTDIKFPATLRQGLNFGRLNGGGRRNTRRNTRRGGFYPSIMGGVVANAPLLAPLAARQGIHLLEEYRRTTRKRRSTRKSHRRRNSGRRA